jgi:hypothetical protein
VWLKGKKNIKDKTLFHFKWNEGFYVRRAVAPLYQKHELNVKGSDYVT